jgi:iron-sulfur cluster assembly protein
MIDNYNPSSKKTIFLTDTALKHFENFIKNNKETIGFSISLSKTGCSGLSYVVNPVKIIPENHSKHVQNNMEFYIDNNAIKYLQGLEIDYVKGQLGTSYLAYDNPNESARCGCGESFTVNN